MNEIYQPSRRLFLLGLTAAAASAAIPKALAIPTAEEVSQFGQLSSRLPERKIWDIMFSTMCDSGPRPLNEEVRWTFMRGDEAVMSMMMNWRATFRWVATPRSEIVVRDGLWVKVDPAHFYTRIHLSSYYGEPVKTADGYRHPSFTECFEWVGGKRTMNTIAAMHPDDSYLIA